MEGSGLTAPFPWFGGKRRIAELVHKRLGNDIEVYSEPFGGSYAVLLWRKTPVAREVVTDTDGGLCNFYRAIQSDPDEVAYWADYPTIHQDLTARHKYLINWIVDHKEDLESDPHYFDSKVAGWWVWGISIWIGGGWCQPEYRKINVSDQIPHVNNKDSGESGVSIQRDILPISDRRPHIKNNDSGSGISIQKKTRPDLIQYFQLLSERLKKVIILNRSWESAVTDTVLQHTPGSPKPPVGIFMDPPYLLNKRSHAIYNSDAIGTTDRLARESFEWVVKHGDKYRIAYCCHEGDFELLEGWDIETKSFSSIRDKERQKTNRDAVMFSPACKKKQENLSLFDL